MTTQSLKILIMIKNPQALYQAMKYMIDHPDKAARMSENAVLVRDKLDKTKILAEWKRFIESI